jgi:hypothetical protein
VWVVRMRAGLRRINASDGALSDARSRAGSGVG